MVIALIASVGVVTRSLHDRGRGVAWFAVFLLTPWSMAAFSVWLAEAPVFVEQSWAGWAALAASLLSLALNLWGFVEIGLLRSDPGPNRFGPPPE